MSDQSIEEPQPLETSVDHDAPQDEERQDVTEGVIEALKTVYDPEIPVNIYELGLVYKVDATPQGQVVVEMTLTSPACPVAGTLPGEVESKVRSVAGVQEATVELVWDPPWGVEKMSEAAPPSAGHRLLIDLLDQPSRRTSPSR